MLIVLPLFFFNTSQFVIVNASKAKALALCYVYNTSKFLRHTPWINTLQCNPANRLFLIFFFWLHILQVETVHESCQNIQHVKWRAMAWIVLLRGCLWDHCLGWALGTGVCYTHLQQLPLGDFCLMPPLPPQPFNWLLQAQSGLRLREAGGGWKNCILLLIWQKPSTTNTMLCTQTPKLGH